MALKLDILANTRQFVGDMKKAGASVEDGLGAVQEIAANAFVGFGPVGAGVGLVAALGFGLLLENLNQQNEAVQRMKEYFADAYRTAAEEGRKYIDQATILAEANSIMFDPDRQAEYNAAQKEGLKIGLDTNTLIMARAGDQKALNVVIEATRRAQEDLDDSARGAGRFSTQKNKTERNELAAIAGDYQRIGELHKSNAEKARQASQISKDLSKEERAQIQRTRDADAARWGAYAQNAQNAISKVQGAGETLRSNLSRPITTDLKIKARVDLTGISRLQQQLISGKSVIIKPGQVLWF